MHLGLSGHVTPKLLIELVFVHKVFRIWTQEFIKGFFTIAKQDKIDHQSTPWHQMCGTIKKCVMPCMITVIIMKHVYMQNLKSWCVFSPPGSERRR